MAQRTIAELDKKLEQLKARKAQLLARESTTQRRQRTRQAIILGGWLLTNRPEIVEEVKAQLVRPQDLSAFGKVVPKLDIDLDDVRVSGTEPH